MFSSSPSLCFSHTALQTSHKTLHRYATLITLSYSIFQEILFHLDPMKGNGTSRSSLVLKDWMKTSRVSKRGRVYVRAAQRWRTKGNCQSRLKLLAEGFPSLSRRSPPPLLLPVWSGAPSHSQTIGINPRSEGAGAQRCQTARSRWPRPALTQRAQQQTPRLKAGVGRSRTEAFPTSDGSSSEM